MTTLERIHEILVENFREVQPDENLSDILPDDGFNWYQLIQKTGHEFGVWIGFINKYPFTTRDLANAIEERLKEGITGDALGFGETFEEAANAAREAQNIQS